jgi:intracellular septation protein
VDSPDFGRHDSAEPNLERRFSSFGRCAKVYQLGYRSNNRGLSNLYQSGNALTQTRPLSPTLKLVLDIGPLALFFAANARFGIFVGTAAFMAAVMAALLVYFLRTRQWPIMPVVSAIVVVVFGGLTLVLHDATFIKLKPTIIYVLFGTVLAVGLAFDKPVLALVFDSVFHLTAEGWRRLGLRWAVFFFALAVLNELVWRTQTTEFWVSFKLFGFVPLTFAFAALQYPLLKRYAVSDDAPAAEAEAGHPDVADQSARGQTPAS